MSISESRQWELFLEVFEALPRQGPGNFACAKRALTLCEALPDRPRILDLGCGAGAQTLQLAELTNGAIVAIDNHAPNIEHLSERAAAAGVADRVEGVCADMAEYADSAEPFDLVWSEGAFYNIGLDAALSVSRRVLKPRGYVAFTDAVWRTDSPSPEVRAMFEDDYPTMGRAGDVAARIREHGFQLLAQFTLPEEAWWDDFYTPMEQRIAELRAQYAEDAEALAILGEIAQEPEMHRKHGSEYAYEFFVARNAD